VSFLGGSDRRDVLHIPTSRGGHDGVCGVDPDPLRSGSLRGCFGGARVDGVWEHASPSGSFSGVLRNDVAIVYGKRPLEYNGVCRLAGHVKNGTEYIARSRAGHPQTADVVRGRGYTHEASVSRVSAALVSARCTDGAVVQRAAGVVDGRPRYSRRFGAPLACAGVWICGGSSSEYSSRLHYKRWLVAGAVVGSRSLVDVRVHTHSRRLGTFVNTYPRVACPAVINTYSRSALPLRGATS
jgi:hypothetical protein